MKKIDFNIKNKEFKLKIQNAEDLWVLSTIIKPGDLISGKTPRKIKYGDQKEKAERKLVFAKIKAEKTELSSSADSLRILGTVVEGPEELPNGSHHSFNLELNSVFMLTKPDIMKFEIQKLEDASKQKPLKILICVHDREKANFALIKNFGYQHLSTLKGEVAKKIENQKKTENFYQKVAEVLQEYSKKYKIENIILASPAFFKEDLMKEIKNNELKQKIILSTCSSAEKGAFDEIMKRGELKTVLEKNKAANDMKLVEEVFIEISKKGNVSYGITETKTASEAGAVKKLIITDKLVKNFMEDKKFQEIEEIMNDTEKNKGEISIISSKNEAGRRIDGLGGIAAVLRFKLNY